MEKLQMLVECQRKSEDVRAARRQNAQTMEPQQQEIEKQSFGEEVE